MTGSPPPARSAIATARGEACACAAGLSVAFTASTQAFMGASWRWISGKPPPSIVGISAVTTNSPAVSLASRRDIPGPARGVVPASAPDQVAPRRRAVQPVVDRRPQPVDVRAPHRQALGALVGLQPHAPHLGLDLARPVRAHPAARPVAQSL